MLMSLLRYLLRSEPEATLDRVYVPEWCEAMAEHQPAIWWTVKPHTKMPVERFVTLCQSIAYLEKHRIPGAIVGGGDCMLTAAMALSTMGSTQRELWSAPSDKIEAIKQPLMQLRYPWEKLVFVPEHTDVMPDVIALAHLDAIEQAERSYERLAIGGILIVDGADLRTIGHGEDQLDAAGGFLIKRSPASTLRIAA